MKFYYEYKEKNGCIVAGHNLDNLEFFDKFIRLSGEDIILTNCGFQSYPWVIYLHYKDIEYFKIMPFLKGKIKNEKFKR